LAKKIAVVGLGNTLRKDDGIGIIILKLLVKNYKREQIDYFNLENCSFDLLYKIKDYDLVFLIDAIDAGLKVGEVKFGELKDLIPFLNSSLTLTHDFNLKDLLRFSQALGIKTKLYLIGIQVKDTSFGESLSKELEEKKNKIIKEINGYINKFLITHGERN